MAIQTSCPACQHSYRLPETQLGKRVRCKGCGDTFIVKAEDDVPVLEEATIDDIRGPARKRPPQEVEELPVLEEAEEEEERESRRRSVRRERPAPAASRRRRDDDDE